jgi:hypothetical protein
MIMNNLTTPDILSLRISCRAFHSIVNSLGPALTRNFIKRDLNRFMTKLYPPPPPDCADLSYMLEMHRRLCACSHLALVMTGVYWTEGGTFPPWIQPRDRKVHKTDMRGCGGLYAVLIPLVLTLCHFFETYRKNMLDRSLRNAKPDGKFELVTGGPTVWEDQMAILETYHPSLVLDCYHVYGYLIHVIKARLVPPRGTKVARVLGSKQFSRPPSTKQLEHLYMLGGIEKLSSIIHPAKYEERRFRLDWLVKKYDPTSNPEMWWRHWGELGIPNNKIRTMKVRLPSFSLIFVPCALESLVRRRTLGRGDLSLVARPTPRHQHHHPMNLIAELVNWKNAEIWGTGVHRSDWGLTTTV